MTGKAESLWSERAKPNKNTWGEEGTEEEKEQGAFCAACSSTKIASYSSALRILAVLSRIHLIDIEWEFCFCTNSSDA